MVSSMLWLYLVCLLCLDSFQWRSWKTSSSSLCAFNIQVVKKDQTKKLILQCSPELAWFHELHTAVLSSHHLFPTHKNMIKSLYWIRVCYQHQVDLSDTQGLSWRDAVIKCLESVSRAMPQLQSDPKPSSSPPRLMDISPEPPKIATCCDMWASAQGKKDSTHHHPGAEAPQTVWPEACFIKQVFFS